MCIRTALFTAMMESPNMKHLGSTPFTKYAPYSIFGYVHAGGIPLAWGDDMEFFGPLFVEHLTTQILNQNHRAFKWGTSGKCSLAEQACLKHLDTLDFDLCISLEDLDFIRTCGFRFRDFHESTVQSWRALRLVYKAWSKKTPILDRHYWFDHFVMNVNVCDATPDQQLQGGKVGLLGNDISDVLYPDGVSYPETQRTIRLVNGLVLVHSYTHNKIMCTYDDSIVQQPHNDIQSHPDLVDILLAQCGDIETNPGPTSQSKPIRPVNREIPVHLYIQEKQQRKVRELEKQIKVLKKKTCSKAQRDIEVNRTLRGRNRKQQATEKRYAQSLVTTVKDTAHKLVDDVKSIASDPSALCEISKCAVYTAANVVAPGTGTAAAAVVNGAKVAGAINKVNPTLEMAQKALQLLIDAGNDFKAIFKIPTDFDLIGVLITICSIGTALMSRSIFSCSLACVQLSRQLGITLESLMSLIPDITDTSIVFGAKTDNPAPVAQSLLSDMLGTATEHTELLPMTGFLAFFSGIFTLLCSGVTPRAGDLLKHFTTIGRAAQGFRSVQDLFKWICDYMAEIYYTTVYGLSAEEYKFIDKYPDIQNLYAAIQIVEKLEKKVIDSSAAIANQILTIHHNLNEYLHEAIKSGSRTSVGMIKNLLIRMKEQHEWASHSPARCVIAREEPFSVYMYGQPGVGKSVMTEVLKAKIFAHYLAARGTVFESMAFARYAKTDYWEGYTNQPIVVLDDFGNVKDSQQSPVEEYEELIRMVNTAQFPLKMAELKSKGVTNFSSEFILASSNQYYPEIKHLTDPGAVYRRFHVWAEVTINPKYGVATNKDSKGKPFYAFDPEKAAEADGCDKSELSRLMTHHYLINLYKVSFNKQTASTEVSPIPTKQNISFDDFWAYLVRENDYRKGHSARLTADIMKYAELTTPPRPPNEKEIMDSFRKIFNPEEFITALAEEELVEVPNVVVDAEQDKFFGDMSYIKICKERTTQLWKTFETHRDYCKSKMTSLLSGLTAVVDVAASKFITVAQFILSCFSSATSRIFSYLPSVPTSKLLTGICSTIIAVFGVWYTGMFRSNPSLDRDNQCDFNSSAPGSSTPCGSCSFCKIVEFPRTGDMLSHYLERTGSKSVREALSRCGIPREATEDRREEVRLYLDQSKVLYPPYQDYYESGATSQGAYDTQPRVPVHRSFAQGAYHTNPTTVPKVVKYAQGVVECKIPVHQGAMKYGPGDLIQTEQTTAALLKNGVWLQVKDQDGICSRSNGVFLTGRTLLTTAHTVMSRPGKSEFHSIDIKNPHAADVHITIPYSQCKISQVKQLDGKLTDLALVSFPPVVPSRPYLLNKFIEAKDLMYLAEGRMVFSGFTSETRNGRVSTVIQEKHPPTFDYSTRATEYLQHSPGTCPKSEHCVCPIRIGHHLTYDLATRSGMCGALLSVANRSIHKKLVGIHVAGGTGMSALGVLTTRELLESALERHAAEMNIPRTHLIDGRVPYAESYVNVDKHTSLVEQGDCISLGTAPAPAVPVKTSLKRSAIFDKVQVHTMMPAALRPIHVEGEGVVNPMTKGIKKIMGPQTWIDPDLLDAAAADVFQSIGPAPEGRGIIHTHAEAIAGIEGDPYKRPINRISSPGYPYNLTNKSKGKTAWMGSDETYITDHPELQADVDALLAKAAQGIRGDAISIATLKDEKRPIEKVLAGKTRVFEACPQHLVVAIRRYFLDFAAHVMENRIKNGIAVGVNPRSTEWTRIASKLQEQGNSLIAGDFSNFDGSLSMQVIVKILDKINEWYDDGEENALIRATLWEHISNADILVNGQVIRKTHSQPSGNPLTVIINSIFNAIVMRVAYMMLKKEVGLPAVCDYRTYVSEIIYGDDDIKSVSVEVLPWFNQITLTKALARIGLTYTDESKSGTVLPHKPLEEVTFLKRHFVQDTDGFYLAPMILENILEITNWVKGGAEKLSTVENCSMVLDELALHPGDVYKKWSACMQTHLVRKNLVLRIPTHFEQRQQYLHDRDVYSVAQYVPLW